VYSSTTFHMAALLRTCNGVANSHLAAQEACKARRMWHDKYTHQALKLSGQLQLEAGAHLHLKIPLRHWGSKIVTLAQELTNDTLRFNTAAVHGSRITMCYKKNCTCTSHVLFMLSCNICRSEHYNLMWLLSPVESHLINPR